MSAVKSERPPSASTETANSRGRLRSVAGHVGAAMRQDVWDIELVTLSRARRMLVRGLRIAQLVYRGFKHDECMLHASSLTFITLLAIVPVLALALSMARVFGAGDLAREQLKFAAREWIAEAPATPVAAPSDAPEGSAPPTPAAASATEPPANAAAGIGDNPAPQVPEGAISLVRIERLIDTGFERIEGLNFRALGGLGIVFLLWSVISVLGQVEAAFNRVWGVTEQRPLLRKFTDYLSVLIVFPVLLIAASSIPTVELAMRLMGENGGAAVGGILGSRLLRFLGILTLLTLSFSFLLRFLPNTRVRPVPSLVGGFVTAILSFGWLRLCAAFQFGVAKNSVFFGSFATVPILLSWVYVSWEILLFGAEVSFAVQTADTYRMEQGASKASLRTRWMIAVDLLAAAARQLRTGDGLLRIPAYVKDRCVSVRLVNDVVRELSERKFLAEVTGEPGAFAVRRDVLNLTVGELAKTLLDTGVPADALGLRTKSASPLRDPLDAALVKILPQRIADIDLDFASKHA